jgi:hypothetical protein
MSDQPVTIVIQPDTWAWLKAMAFAAAFYFLGRWDQHRFTKRKDPTHD